MMRDDSLPSFFPSSLSSSLPSCLPANLLMVCSREILRRSTRQLVLALEFDDAPQGSSMSSQNLRTIKARAQLSKEGQQI